MLKHLVRTLYNIAKHLLPKTGNIFCFTISYDIIIGLTQNYLRRYVFYQGLFFVVHIIFNVMNDVCILHSQWHCSLLSV